MSLTERQELSEFAMQKFSVKQLRRAYKLNIPVPNNNFWPDQITGAHGYFDNNPDIHGADILVPKFDSRPLVSDEILKLDLANLDRLVGRCLMGYPDSLEVPRFSADLNEALKILRSDWSLEVNLEGCTLVCKLDKITTKIEGGNLAKAICQAALILARGIGR